MAHNAQLVVNNNTVVDDEYQQQTGVVMIVLQMVQKYQPAAFVKAQRPAVEPS